VRTDPLSRVLRRFDGSLVARHLAGIGALTAASVGTLWMLAPSGPWLWLATAVQLALAAGLVLAFARRVLEPLRGLERTAHRVASGRLDDRSGLERRDEIGRAARALDHLALVFAAVVSDLRDLDGSGPDAAGDPPDAGAARVAAAAERAAAAALQTRALALHAAIEAARSGERGRALARLSHDLRRLALDGTDAVRVAARRGARTEPGQVGRDVRALARLGARAGRLARVLEAPPSRDRGGSGA
jgi:methyl-accepting chemotaxis protein